MFKSKDYILEIEMNLYCVLLKMRASFAETKVPVPVLCSLENSVCSNNFYGFNRKMAFT